MKSSTEVVRQSIIDNENTAKLNKLNAKDKKNRRPIPYPYTLLRFTDLDDIVYYFNKVRHPQREDLPGSVAKITHSNTRFFVRNDGISPFATDKFIKTIKADENISIHQIENSAKVTQLMYPTTRYCFAKPDKIRIMMDTIPRTDLLTMITNGSLAEFTLPQLIRIAINCAAEVQRLLALGYLHCDIKPENFLVCPRTLAVSLIDFDFAVKPEESNQANGTPDYMAPELLDPATNRKNNLATELYSLGMVFFCILSREEALQKLTSYKIGPKENPYLHNITFKLNEFNEKFITEHLSASNTALINIIALLCHPNADNRPGSYISVIRDLERAFKLTNEPANKKALEAENTDPNIVPRLGFSNP
jgi:serine/threonine protein kinase